MAVDYTPGSSGTEVTAVGIRRPSSSGDSIYRRLEQLLCEAWISVADFGAQVSAYSSPPFDSTSAFTAAIDAAPTGSQILIPAGDYTLTESTVLNHTSPQSSHTWLALGATVNGGVPTSWPGDFVTSLTGGAQATTDYTTPKQSIHIPYFDNFLMEWGNFNSTVAPGAHAVTFSSTFAAAPIIICQPYRATSSTWYSPPITARSTTGFTLSNPWSVTWDDFFWIAIGQKA